MHPKASNAEDQGIADDDLPALPGDLSAG